MFEITLSEAASDANCGSKLVSAIDITTRSVFAGSAASAGDARSRHAATQKASIANAVPDRNVACLVPIRCPPSAVFVPMPQS